MTWIPATLSLAACTAVSAQPLYRGLDVYHHISWKEVDAQTGLTVPDPNGILEPGEAALVTLSLSFSPDVRKPAPAPWWAPGYRIYALRGCDSVAVSTHRDIGTWSHGELRAGWFGDGGAPPGGIHEPAVLVMALQSREGANQGNPVEVWQGRWVPDDFSRRDVIMHTWPWGFDPQMTCFLWMLQERSPIGFFFVSAEPHIDVIQIPVDVRAPVCYPNCDNSTTEPILTVDDFTCFINEFASAQALPPAQQIEHYANCDGSTTEPVLTVDDFTCFINSFAQGCL